MAAFRAFRASRELQVGLKWVISRQQWRAGYVSLIALLKAALTMLSVRPNVHPSVAAHLFGRIIDASAQLSRVRARAFERCLQLASCQPSLAKPV